MAPRSSFVRLPAILAAAGAAIFLAISVDRGLYAPGAHHLSARLPQHVNAELDTIRLIRKIYSVIAFAILGTLLAPLVPRSRRARSTAAAVAAFSATIEIVQRLTVSHEGNRSSLFDIGCGALGGLLGAWIWNAIESLRDDRARQAR
jgi:hypothetical protein